MVRSSGGGKKRCTKGKSCGATCISKTKICIMETGGGISSGLGKLSSEIPKFEGRTAPSDKGVYGGLEQKGGVEKFGISKQRGEATTRFPETAGRGTIGDALRQEVFNRELMDAISKVDDKRVEKRVKELARKFKDENGRFPNRKGERDELRSQAIKEQLDSIRKTKKDRENTARAISEGLALSPRAGRESDLYSKYRKIVSERPVQMIQGSDKLRAKDNESVVRAIRRVIKLEQDSGKPLSEKEIMKMIGEFSREEYGKIMEAERKGDFLGRFRLGG